MQMMGPRYKVWEQAAAIDSLGVPGLDEAQRNAFHNPGMWPHPRLRALLQEILDINQLSLPWLPPSLPWWSLRGGWKNSGFSKVLIFSRFRAVPQSIASLLSYEIETHLFARGDLDYSDITKRRILNPTPKRQTLLALFCPSPWLIDNTDPLRGGRASVSVTRKKIRKQVLTALRKVGVTYRKTAHGKRPIWHLLAQIEKEAGNWHYVRDAWWQIHSDVGHGRREGAGLAGLIDDWAVKADEPIGYVTSAEVDELAEYALSSPGVVLGRALKRLWPDALSSKTRDRNGFYATLDAAWNGLRNYLDQRWFVASLRKSGSYPKALLKAVVDGNLEAVLDEYLWISGTVSGLRGPELAYALKDALRLRSGNYRLHKLGSELQDTFSLRCHVAIPFTDPQKLVIGDEEKPLRQDEIRKSFNAPFWPYVLATTSVGQEGLDFHVWCDRLVHWDLSRNPVDWEQREGRIQRYGGLAIRRAIASQLGAKLWSSLKSGTSPWEQLAAMADDELADDSGLKPWWICPGADIKRYVFDVPLSEQKYQLQWIRRQRMLYRMALGQPHQEDLISFIDERTDIEPEQLREAMLQLSPWFGNDEST